MPRPRRIVPPRRLRVNLPPDLATRLDLYLVSGVTGKVPAGAYEKFFTERVLAFFSALDSALKEQANDA